MEDFVSCEVIKCESYEDDFLPKPDGVHNDLGKHDEVILNVRDSSAMADSEDQKFGVEHVGMFEFVGLHTLPNNECSIEDGASEKTMIGKMRANIVKALCMNTSSSLSKPSDRKPVVVGDELVSHMKTTINTIIGCEENSEELDERRDDEDVAQLSQNIYSSKKSCKLLNQKRALKRRSQTHGKYTCAACNMNFQKKYSLLNHVRHTPCGLLFKCSTCGVAFKYKSKLVNHKKVHNCRVFCCKKCSKTFKYEPWFLKHKSVCQDNFHKCMICWKIFSGPEELKSHVAAVHDINKKPFQCNACGKRFMRESFYRRHVLIFCGKKIANNCDVCGEVFEEISSLKLHMLTHKAANLYTCERCSMTFKDRDALILHVQKYINEDGFKCDYCDKPFLFKSELISHKMRHSTYRSFGCNRCTATFAYKGSLRAHMIIHSVEPFVCGKCGKEFETDDDLKRHKQTHFQSFDCQFCDKSFNDLREFRLHAHADTNEKSMTCKTCVQTFKSKRALAKHIIVSHLNKQFSCSICLRAFKFMSTWRRHMFRAHNKFR